MIKTIQYAHVLRFFKKEMDKYLIFDTISNIEIEVNAFGYYIIDVIRTFKKIEFETLLNIIKDKYLTCNINDIENFINQLIKLSIIVEGKK